MEKVSDKPTPNDKPATKLVATQQTFAFKKSIFESTTEFTTRIDTIINKWLLIRSNDGTPAQLGKTFSNHRTGEVYYIFLYSRKIVVSAVDQAIKSHNKEIKNGQGN